MKVEQQLLDNVELKLNKQNALKASLAAAFLTIPLLMIWYLVYSYKPQFGSIMMVPTGIAIGLAVRILGRGMNALFPAIAFVTYTWIVVVAFSLDIVLSGTIWAFLILVIYVAGAGAAIFIARIDVPFEEHRAYSYLTERQRHSSYAKNKNRWFIVVPVLVLTGALSTFLSGFGIVVIGEYKFQNDMFQYAQRQEQLAQNKEIDVTPQGLEKISTQDILLYSYAYHSGLLFNSRGTHSTRFPKSKFKAETVLKYLVKYRDSARAKFILGFAIDETKERALIDEAAEQGDKYAKIYSAVGFGCNTDSDLAIKELKMMERLAVEEYVQEEINSILYIGFNRICYDVEKPEFYLSYALNFNESSD